MSIKKNLLKKSNSESVDFYFEGIQHKNITVLSKAITLLESTKDTHQSIADELIERCLPLAGKSLRIGITGVPGVGKSTFIDSFGKYLIETENKKIAVLAIDPSSTKNKGSILGDKTRMNYLSISENAFVRPSPSAGTLGGVAKATRETIILCEAFGFDTIIIETVGVGQSETEVHSMVDFFLLLMLAGAGDELQGIKRGIMEMADAIVINKTDMENMDRVKLAQQHYNNALHLFPTNENGWIPKVEVCSAINSTGIENSWKVISLFQQQTSTNGWFDKKRKQQAKFWLTETINQSILSIFYNNTDNKTLLQQLEKDVINGKISPFKAAKTIINKYNKR